MRGRSPPEPGGPELISSASANISRVIHRVFNVAEGNGWAVRFASRGPLRAAPGRFAEEVRLLGERLGVQAWVT